MAKVYVATIGFRITLDVEEALASATAVTMRILKPDNTALSKTPVVSGTTMYYDTIVTDFSVAGDYAVQGEFTLSGWTGRTETICITVYDNFK